MWRQVLLFYHHVDLTRISYNQTNVQQFCLVFPLFTQAKNIQTVKEKNVVENTQQDVVFAQNLHLISVMFYCMCKI